MQHVELDERFCDALHPDRQVQSGILARVAIGSMPVFQTLPRVHAAFPTGGTKACVPSQAMNRSGQIATGFPAAFRNPKP